MFKKLHIRIGEHNYVQADEIDEDDQDLGIDPIHMGKILKSNIILKIGHLHFSKINTVDGKKWMDRILEKLCENQNCLTSLEIRNCEMVSSLKVEKLLPNLQTLVLFDRTGHDNFFKSRAKFSADFATKTVCPGGLFPIVAKIARSDNPLEKLLIHHNDIDKIDDEIVSDAFCKMKEIETTWTMSKTQMTLMFHKIADGCSNIRKLIVEEWGKIQLEYSEITPQVFTKAICRIEELKMNFASKEHTKLFFETLSRNPGQLKSLTFTDSYSIEEFADAETIAQAVCNLEEVFFEFDISESLQTAIFRTIAEEKGVKLKTLHKKSSAIKCPDTKTFIKATLKLENIYFIFGEDLVAKSAENLLLDSMLEQENCCLQSVTLIFRNPKHYFNNKKLFQYPEDKLVRIKEKIAKLNIYYSPFLSGGFERII